MQESTLTIEGFTPYAQVPKWIIRSGKGLSHGAVRLYGTIMAYADNQSKAAFPSQETLSKDMGASVRSIRNYMEELEKFGALKVERRRNKKTGNFYANRYALIFTEPQKPTSEPSATECRPPTAAECRITTPTVELDPPYFTSEQDSEQMLHPHSYERGSENKQSAGELADPISPAWYASQDRQIIIRNIQAIAKAKAAKDPITAAHLVETLHDNLCKAFNSDGDGIDSLIWDYNWEPKKPQADPKQAAIWLNKLIGKWKGYTKVTWRGPTT